MKNIVVILTIGTLVSLVGCGTTPSERTTGGAAAGAATGAGIGAIAGPPGVVGAGLSLAAELAQLPAQSRVRVTSISASRSGSSSEGGFR